MQEDRARGQEVGAAVRRTPPLSCTSAEYGALQKLCHTSTCLRRRILWRRPEKAKRCANSVSVIHIVLFEGSVMVSHGNDDGFVGSGGKSTVISVFSGWFSVAFSF